MAKDQVQKFLNTTSETSEQTPIEAVLEDELAGEEISHEFLDSLLYVMLPVSKSVNHK